MSPLFILGGVIQLCVLAFCWSGPAFVFWLFWLIIISLVIRHRGTKFINFLAGLVFVYLSSWQATIIPGLLILAEVVWENTAPRVARVSYRPEAWPLDDRGELGGIEIHYEVGDIAEYRRKLPNCPRCGCQMPYHRMMAVQEFGKLGDYFHQGSYDSGQRAFVCPQCGKLWA